MAGGPYHLVYFDAYARGEPIRWVFAAAGVPYTEERVVNDIDLWNKEIKATAGPFNSLPYMTVGEGNGKKTLAQHITMCRYLGNKFGLVADDDFDRALSDMYADGTTDLWHKMEPYVMAHIFDKEKSTQEKKDQTKADLLAAINAYVERYTGFLLKSGGKYFTGNKLTWADLYIAEWLDRIERFIGVKIEGPMKQFLTDVVSVPSIKLYLENRPESPFNC